MTWPPKVGQRMCKDTGFADTSWSGEVRAVVDDEVAIVRRWLRHKQWHRYEVLDRLDFKFSAESEKPIYFAGPLRLTTIQARR
jgi:hypothetical protein